MFGVDTAAVGQREKGGHQTERTQSKLTKIKAISMAKRQLIVSPRSKKAVAVGGVKRLASEEGGQPSSQDRGGKRSSQVETIGTKAAVPLLPKLKTGKLQKTRIDINDVLESPKDNEADHDDRPTSRESSVEEKQVKSLNRSKT